MTYNRMVTLLTLGLASVAIATAGAEYKCTADIQDCLDEMYTQLRNRGWVGLELSQDEDTYLLSVTRVVPGSPAEKAGFAEGDVLVALNGVRYDDDSNSEALAKERKGMIPGRHITYTVARDGEEIELQVELASLPKDVLAQWIGMHMLEHHTHQTLAKN